MKPLLIFLLLCGAAAAQCGPPAYNCTSNSTAIVQTPNTPPFISRLPTGTVNTSNSAIGPCSPTAGQSCIQSASGDPFVTSWSSGISPGDGGNLKVNGVTCEAITWNSTTVATVFCTAALGTLTGVTWSNYTACIGDCANQVRYDTSLNPVGRNPILRASDGGSASGRFLASTFSGGDNDEGWNCAGRTDTSAACKNATLYLLALTNGGCEYVEGFELINGIPQVVAPLPNSATGTSFSPCGAITWSHQNPFVGYFMGRPTAGPQVNDPVIYSITYAWDGVIGHPLTFGAPVLVYDIGLSSGILPNGQAYNAGWSGPLSEDINDQLFWIALSNVQGISSGTDTITLTNGAAAFTLTGATALATDGSSVNSLVTINGIPNTYTIATVTGGGFTGTISPVWAGANGTYSFAQISGQGSGLHAFAVTGLWSGTPGASTYTGSGASLYNTFTGAVTASGTATGGALDVSCQFHIHDSFGFIASQYAWISGGSGNCGPLLYQALTNHAVLSSANSTLGGPIFAGGHQSNGQKSVVIINNPNYYDISPVSNANSVTPIAPFSNATGGCENHFTWRHADALDSVPIVLASGNNNYGLAASGCTSSASCWPAPYYNEIDALPISGATPKRFAHSFILGPGDGVGCGNGNIGPFDAYFTAEYAIGVTSQDGRLFEWPSSMLGNLGTDSVGNTAAAIFVMALDGPSVSPSGQLSNGAKMVNGAVIR